MIDAFAIGFGLDLASPDEVWRPEGETRTLGRLLEVGAAILIDSLRARLPR